MVVPESLHARRALLEKLLQEAEKTAADAERERAVRAAQLEELDVAIAMIEAHICARAHTEVSGKRRPLRQMVLDVVLQGGFSNVETVAKDLNTKKSTVTSAIDHWLRQNRIEATSAGGYAAKDLPVAA